MHLVGSLVGAAGRAHRVRQPGYDICMWAYMAAVFGGGGAGWLWSEIKILKDPDLAWVAGLF
jgi:hypothetical protein